MVYFDDPKCHVSVTFVQWYRTVISANKRLGSQIWREAMISIVDDDVFVRESIRTLVESLGYEVATFESAERFLESERLPQPSCLITDLQMPGLSGLDLQGRLK